MANCLAGDSALHQDEMGLAFGKLWSRLFGQEEIKIIIVGLDNSGKTTILYKL